MPANSIETELALIRFRLDTIVASLQRVDNLEGRVDVLERRNIAADAARESEDTVKLAHPRSRKQLLVVSGASAGGGATLGILIERVLALLI